MNIVVKEFLLKYLKKYRGKIFVFFSISVFAGVLEMVGIGLVFPFIYLLVAPDSIQIFPFLAWLKNIFGLNMKGLNLALLCSITCILLLKNLYMLMFHYLQMKVISKAKSEFSSRLMKMYLYLDYNIHLSKDPSEVIRNVALTPVVFDHYILSIFNIFVASMLAMGVLVLLFVVLTFETVFASLVLGVVLVWAHRRLKKVFSKIGTEADEIYHDRQKVLSASVSSLRETKIMAKEGFFVKRFFNIEKRNYNNQQFYNFVATIPVLIIESCIIGSVLALILFYLIQHKQAHALAILSLLVASMFRVLPLTNKILTALQLMNRSGSMLNTIVEEIAAYEHKASFPDPLATEQALTLKDSISIEKVSFRYPEKEKDVIKNVSLKILKGQFVGIVGKSGSGKSTLLDMLLGLIDPNEGALKIDGSFLNDPIIKRTWKKNIAYVPQNIYLLNDNIMNNIAFGVEADDIDCEQIKKAVKLAEFEDVLNTLPKGLKEHIGENGLKLSTGQRQRIGIARAFYNKNAEFIALDEATSNLDAFTEAKIIKTLHELKGRNTIVLVSHNMSLIKECDTIFVMEDGKVVEQGDFAHLCNSGKIFQNCFNIEQLQEEIAIA